MIWLNGLLAVPAIGIRITPHYGDIHTFENQITNFLDYLSKDFKDFKIEKKGNWGYNISPKESGYRFDIEPNNLVASFGYAILQKPVAGGFPTFQMPTLQNYQELQSALIKYIKHLLGLLDKLSGFKYDRIGLIADMTLEKDSIPPGVLEWIDKLSETIKGDMIIMGSSFQTKIEETDDYTHKCFHIVKYDNSKPEIGYEIKLDWQREYKEKANLNSKKMYPILDDCIKISTQYFKDFGEGVLNE